MMKNEHLSDGKCFVNITEETGEQERRGERKEEYYVTDEFSFCFFTFKKFWLCCKTWNREFVLLKFVFLIVKTTFKIFIMSSLYNSGSTWEVVLMMPLWLEHVW